MEKAKKSLKKKSSVKTTPKHKSISSFFKEEGKRINGNKNEVPRKILEDDCQITHIVKTEQLENLQQNKVTVLPCGEENKTTLSCEKVTENKILPCTTPLTLISDKKKSSAKLSLKKHSNTLLPATPDISKNESSKRTTNSCNNKEEDTSYILPPTPTTVKNKNKMTSNSKSKISSCINMGVLVGSYDVIKTGTKIKSESFREMEMTQEKLSTLLDANAMKNNIKPSSKTFNNKVSNFNMLPASSIVKKKSSLVNTNSKSSKKLKLSLSTKRKNTFVEESRTKQINLDETDFCKKKSDNIANEYLSYISPDNKIFDDFVTMKDIVQDNNMTHIKQKVTPIENEYIDDLFDEELEMNEDSLSKPRVDSTTVHGTSADIDDINLDDSFNLGVEPSSVILIWIIKDILFIGTSEKILKLQNKKKTCLQADCHLKDDWFYMEVSIGDLAYVSGLSELNLQCILDNNSPHHITLYPSTLISGTTIASGITCERQAILNERFKMEYQNDAMLLGNIVHDLFDWALSQKIVSKETLEQRARELLQTRNFMESLYQLSLSEDEILKRMKEYYTSIENWFQCFLFNPNGKEIEFRLGSKCNAEDDVNCRVSVDRVVDIEEMIWTPSYGLKGMIDVNVEVTVHKRDKRNKNSSKYMLPLELKTGKMWAKQGSLEHRAQLAVYSIMMNEKYENDISTGLLYYIKANHMQGIPMPAQEKRAIIIKRNEIARKLTLEKIHTELPELLTNKRICKRCSQNKNCALYNKSLESGTSTRPSGELNELFEELTSHLTQEDYIFFNKWYNLVLDEVSYSISAAKRTSTIWERTSEELERSGNCFSGMIVNEELSSNDSESLVYCFQRRKNHWNCAKSFKHFSISVGDRVILSVEGSRVFNISTGYVFEMSDNTIKVKLLRKIPKTCSNSLFRIDRDNSVASITCLFSNLAKLFSCDNGYEEKLRRLIIKKETPWFVDTGYVLQKNVEQIICKLNKVQQKAILKVLKAEDYLLILGMPGSGKSTTIATLVKVLVAIGKSVLLTSYTHSAVDTILLKLIAADFHDFVRLGQASRVNLKIKPYTNEKKTEMLKNASELADFYKLQKVVATTCLSVNHALFKHKLFDYCIVDEASQITQPVCLGPITHAKTFILVGDHNQLPPLVQSESARKNGLDISLFNYLADVSPNAIVSLNYQYRMNADIMSLANHLVYNSTMKCANNDIANAKLELHGFDNHSTDPEKRYLFEIINPNQSVVFVNTDNKPLLEKKMFANITNKGEANLVACIVNELLQHGLTAKDIGIITPYRRQIHVIREEMTLLNIHEDYLEVDTVDKYQGKDKKCIIVSFVRSNTQNETGDLLKDWRRVNVAITRPKHKLILIGSKNTLINSTFMKSLIEIIEKKSWIFNL